MSRQDIRQGTIDLITPGELGDQLHAHLGTAFSRHLRETLRGISYIRRDIKNPPSNNVTGSYSVSGTWFDYVIDGPESGYFWDLRLVSLSNVNQAAYTAEGVFLDEQYMIPTALPIAVAANNNAVFFYSKAQCVVRASERLHILTNSANIQSIHISAVQVPEEMQGKILT